MKPLQTLLALAVLGASLALAGCSGGESTDDSTAATPAANDANAASAAPVQAANAGARAFTPGKTPR